MGARQGSAPSLSIDLDSAVLGPPVMGKTEVWGAGVTYSSSEAARVEEAKSTKTIYQKVLVAERPELFFKSTPHRTVGHNGVIRARADALSTVPEPEMGIALNSSAEIVGYCLVNDVTARSIEAENPLYLPQAKIYNGCCAIGPIHTNIRNVKDITIRCTVRNSLSNVKYDATYSVSSMRRSVSSLVAALFTENSFPEGVILTVGTGIVPPPNFTLIDGDIVEITSPQLGMLRNLVSIAH